MNYIQILQDSLQLFRTTRLIWVFAFLSLILTIPLIPSQSLRDNPVLACIYLPILIGGLILSMTATGSLYYAIYQVSLKRNVSFSEAWVQGKSKMLYNIGLILVSIPILLIGAFFIRLITAKLPTSPLLWLIVFGESLFIVTFSTFGFCAIAIDNVKVLASAWTSLLITINNFFRVSVITASMFLIRLLITGLIVLILASGSFGIELPRPLSLDYPTYQKIVAIPIVAWATWIFDLFFFPLEAIMLTFAYLKFTKEVSYPALVQKQNTA
jgi:hypothetical protein